MDTQTLVVFLLCWRWRRAFNARRITSDARPRIHKTAQTPPHLAALVLRRVAVDEELLREGREGASDDRVDALDGAGGGEGPAGAALGVGGGGWRRVEWEGGG